MPSLAGIDIGIVQGEHSARNSADLSVSELAFQGAEATLTDDIGGVREAFTVRGTFSIEATLLDETLSGSDTTITCDSTTGFMSTGYIKIEEEIIIYSGITGTTFTGCTRGRWGTTAVGHADDTEIMQWKKSSFDLIHRNQVTGVAGFKTHSYVGKLTPAATVAIQSLDFDYDTTSPHVMRYEITLVRGVASS